MNADPVSGIWERYTEALGTLGALVDNTPIALDEVNRAAGYRHLARILYMGLLSVHDYGSSTDPHVYLAKTPTQLTGGVTSDCIYYEAFFDGEQTHRLSGTRGTAPLLEITVIAGKIGVTERGDVVDSIREDTLVVENDRFEVSLSPDPRPEGFSGNWLQTSHPQRGVATYMIIRQYSTDAGAVVPAQIEIQPVDRARHREPVSPREIDDALQASVDFTRILVSHWTAMTAGMIEGLENEFLIVGEIAAADEPMPTGHRFSTAGFRLDPTQAWLVTIPGVANAPYDAAPYWGFQLCNYWFEPIDYGAHWGHRNLATASPDANGDVTLVIAEGDPGPAYRDNWVELRGHRMGNAQFRLSRVAEPLPAIRTEVVDLADLVRE